MILMKNKFYIKHFSDQQEVKETETHKVIDLGLLPTDDYDYFRYFGLFYSGSKPSYKKIIKSLKNKVMVGSFAHSYTGKEIGIDFNYVEEQVKKKLK